MSTERCKNMQMIGENTGGGVFWCPVCGIVEDEFPPIDRRIPEVIADSHTSCEDYG